MRDGWRAFQRSAVSSSVWFVHLKYPWFPFYGNDFLVSTIGLSCEQVGIYIRLLCIQWDNGGLPNDPAKLADMVGSHGLATAVPVHLFGLCQDGLLRNQRLEEIRKERIQYSATQAEKGKKRWKKHAVAQPVLNNGSSPAQQVHEPNVSLSQSQSHSERESVVPPLSREEYDREFSTRPWTKDFLEYYWRELDAVCNWQPKNCPRPLDRKGVGGWLANRWPNWQTVKARGNGSPAKESNAEREARIARQEREAEERKQKEIEDAKALGAQPMGNFLNKFKEEEANREKRLQNPNYHPDA